jgi:hypothetical protein
MHELTRKRERRASDREPVLALCFQIPLQASLHGIVQTHRPLASRMALLGRQGRRQPRAERRLEEKGAGNDFEEVLNHFEVVENDFEQARNDLEFAGNDLEDPLNHFEEALNHFEGVENDLEEVK